MLRKIKIYQQINFKIKWIFLKKIVVKGTLLLKKMWIELSIKCVVSITGMLQSWLHWMLVVIYRFSGRYLDMIFVANAQKTFFFSSLHLILFHIIIIMTSVLFSLLIWMVVREFAIYLVLLCFGFCFVCSFLGL